MHFMGTPGWRARRILCDSPQALASACAINALQHAVARFFGLQSRGASRGVFSSRRSPSSSCRPAARGVGAIACSLVACRMRRRHVQAAAEPQALVCRRRSPRPPTTATATTCSRPASARRDSAARRRTVANPTAPTAAELRRLAICNNYRAILDIAANGGYGTLYGPNIDVNGNPTLGEGKIAGTEYLAYADDGTGKLNVTHDGADPDFVHADKACIVTAASSGSRGVYGAIGSAGEWGLKHGCAVAYTDKGTGTGVHDLATNTVNLQNGTRAARRRGRQELELHGRRSPASEPGAFNAAFPNRFAIKHAHSQHNPEKDWGRTRSTPSASPSTCSTRSARRATATALPRCDFKPDNTIVIASSVSNGGGAAHRRRRAGHRGPDRRRRGRRAERSSSRRRSAHGRSAAAYATPARPAAVRLLHAGQPVQPCASLSAARRRDRPAAPLLQCRRSR